MARLPGPSSLIAQLGVTALLAGCATSQFAAREFRSVAPLGEEALCATGPEPIRLVAGSLPAMTTTLANGIIWVGCNVLTVEGADLSEYDSGDGVAFGVAFGNGEDVKRFFEVAYEETDGHLIRTPTTEAGNMTHRRFYVGGRYYLMPSGGRVRRMVPVVMAGVAWHTLKNYGAGGTTDSAIEKASGLGVYAGTGLELYISSQLSLCFDLRGSYWNWEGVPEDTGAQGTVGTAMTLTFHF